MKVEVWSDVVCPWCYIGKRRFEEALSLFAHRDEVELVWRSFQLDPSTPADSPETMPDHLSRKYNMSHNEALGQIARTTAAAAMVGLEFHMDDAITANTFDAHRMLHLARANGLQPAAKERLMRAYFTETKNIGDHEILVELMMEVGLDEDDIRIALKNDTYAEDVRTEESTARDLDVTGVPFYVIDRAYGISGAQPTDVFLDALQEAWEESHEA